MASGKKFVKRYKDSKTGRERTVRYGEKGSDIRPNTSKGDAYCARSYGQMKDHPEAAKDPNSPLRLSRAKWRCRGKDSVAKSMGAAGAQGMQSGGATGMLSYGAGLSGKAKIASMVKSYCQMQKSAEQDNDSHMSLSNIRAMAHHINEILASTNFDEDHEDWVDAKLTLAADYLATVAHYLEGGKDEELSKSCDRIRERMKGMGASRPN